MARRDNSVTVFEVGPRDGLQNESRSITRATRLKFIQGLIAAGLREIELGAFVRVDRVPQMADTPWVYEQIRAGRLRLGPARGWALVPNRKGLERALACGARRIAVFTAASDSFARRNIGMSIDQSLKEFHAVIREARAHGIAPASIRAYVSTAFGCPFEGAVKPRQTLRVIERLADLGVGQISIGDTIGVATPKSIEAVIAPALLMLGTEATAGHFHDTRGTALANALRALELGVRTLDSSAGGLGGCPFAPGATGNLATEDLVYMLEGMGMRTGVDLRKLCRVSLELARAMKRPLTSRYLQAFSSVGPTCAAR